MIGHQRPTSQHGLPRRILGDAYLYLEIATQLEARHLALFAGMEDLVFIEHVCKWRRFNVAQPVVDHGVPERNVRRKTPLRSGKTLSDR
jgi:hypothetical protein